jgi:hypothetical protein
MLVIQTESKGNIQKICLAVIVFFYIIYCPVFYLKRFRDCILSLLGSDKNLFYWPQLIEV